MGEGGDIRVLRNGFRFWTPCHEFKNGDPSRLFRLGCVILKIPFNILSYY